MTALDTVGQQQQTPTVGAFIQQLVPEIQRALPKGLDADRIARLALTVVRTSDLAAKKANKPALSLARCTPESFAGALLTAAALGLEPGVSGEAYLVPHAGECTLIVGYQGFAKLFWQHPLAKHLDAQAVHERDEFDYALGLDPFLTHKPARGDRGPITDYYAVASLTSGARVFVVLTADEVRALRSGKEGPSGKIPDPQHWMERKTALRQLVKMLPKSTSLAHAVDSDEKSGTYLAGTLPALPPAPMPAADPSTGEVLDEPAVEWPTLPEVQP